MKKFLAEDREELEGIRIDILQKYSAPEMISLMFWKLKGHTLRRTIQLDDLLRGTQGYSIEEKRKSSARGGPCASFLAHVVACKEKY